jgi:DNA-binding transcriptional LysR family regulator
MPAVPIHLAWHQRYDPDPAHTWLRDQARTILQAACRPPADATDDA